MADAKKVTKGKTALERMLTKLPEAKRSNLAALLDEEDALELIGEDVLRQEDYSRSMNEATAATQRAQTHKDNLDNWWKDTNTELNALKVENALLKEGKAPAAGGAPAGGAPPLKTEGVDLTGYVKQEDVDKRIRDAQAQVVPLFSALNKYSMKHLKEFDEILDTDALVAFCQKNGMPIDRGGYEAFAKEKIDAKAAKTQDETIKAAEKRGEDRARAAIGAHTPYPVGQQEPSTLDGLDKAKVTEAQYGVTKAIQTFNDLVSKRG